MRNILARSLRFLVDGGTTKHTANIVKFSNGYTTHLQNISFSLRHRFFLSLYEDFLNKMFVNYEEIATLQTV